MKLGTRGELDSRMKRAFSSKARRQEQAPLETGELNNGDTYEIRLLNLSHLDAIHQLHLDICDALKAEEQTFITRKSRGDFEAYLKGKGEIVGAFSNGKIIAIGSLLLPTKDHPETGTADMEMTLPVDKVAVLQSASVLPEYRGNRLQQKMINARIKLARNMGREYVLALADTKNMATIKSLLHGGLNVVSAGIDPDDGGEIYHMMGSLTEAGQAPAKKINRIFKR